MVVLTDPRWLQFEFSTLVGLFNRVGLSWHGMLPIPGGGDPVRGSLRVTDYGRGNFLPGAAEETGAVQGVWGGDGGWIYGRTHEDTTWATGRGDMEL